MERIRKQSVLILLAGFISLVYFSAVSPAFAEENKGFILAQELQNFFVGLAEQVKSSVVAVEPIKSFAEPPQEENMPDVKSEEPDKPPDEDKGGYGSGAIISPDGYVVSNYHVVGDSNEMKLILSDKRVLIAKVIGRDPETDLALMKIDAETKFPFAPLGNSDEVKIGQWVIAIGKPFGLTGTTTFGIVSGLNRDDIGLHQYENFIQTDAALNPGNSGGPSFNIKGELIGINTGVINMADNIGFMIPVNMVKEVISQLQRNGRVSRGWLGVAIQASAEGVLVTDVFIGQPADQVGIKIGDIIIKVEGVAIKTPQQLSRIIAGFKLGMIIELEIVREGEIKKFSLTLANRNDMKS